MGTQGYFHMDSDGLGGAVFAWLDVRDGGQPQVYIHRILGSGANAPGWPAGGLALTSGVFVGGHYEPTVAPDGIGGLFVGWSNNVTCPEHGCPPPTLRRVLVHAHDGIVDWTKAVTGASTVIVPDGAGGVLWLHEALGVSRVNAGGVILWTTAIPDPNVDYWRWLSPDGAGGGYAFWMRRTPNDYGIGAQHLSGSGVPVSGWPPGGLTVADAPRIQWPSPSSCVVDGQGGATFIWRDLRDGLGNLYALHLDSGGSVTPGWALEGNVVCDAPGGQEYVTAVGTSPNNIMIAWLDWRNGERDVYAQKLVLDAAVATMVSLVRAEAGPSMVHLEWDVPALGVLRWDVLRRTPETDWEPIATVIPDGTGRIRHEDHDVLTGQRYGYRIHGGSSGSESDEAWVTIPMYELSLGGAKPNPSTGDLRIALSLPSRDQAVLELYDVAGRAVRVTEVGHLGPGSHLVSFDTLGSIPPGLYFVRLQQGQRVLCSRACILR
jgi:hypothetical protein